jgi:hypothetical protein
MFFFSVLRGNAVRLWNRIYNLNHLTIYESQATAGLIKFRNGMDWFASVYPIYLLTYPWSRVLPEKLKRPELKKFPAFYGTRRFITAFTRACHLSLSWARLIQSMLPHPTSRRSILILSSHLRLGLPSGLLPSGVPTKALYAPLLSPIRATCPAHLSSWVDHPNDIWWGVQSIKLFATNTTPHIISAVDEISCTCWYHFRVIMLECVQGLC